MTARFAALPRHALFDQLDITSPEAYNELAAAEQKYFVDMVRGARSSLSGRVALLN